MNDTAFFVLLALLVVLTLAGYFSDVASRRRLERSTRQYYVAKLKLESLVAKQTHEHQHHVEEILSQGREELVEGDAYQ